MDSMKTFSRLDWVSCFKVVVPVLLSVILGSVLRPRWRKATSMNGESVKKTVGDRSAEKLKEAAECVMDYVLLRNIDAIPPTNQKAPV